MVNLTYMIMEPTKTMTNFILRFDDGQFSDLVLGNEEV